MKLLFDQNLSNRLSSRLQDLFPGSIHVRQIGRRDAADPLIWTYARENGFTIVSKDSDYRLLSSGFGHPPTVIWIRSGNGPTEEVELLIRDNYYEIEAFGQNPRRSVLELG